MILSVQHNREAFIHSLLAVAAKLRDRFILLAPTASMLDGRCQEALKNIGAKFYSIEQVFTLTPQGNLHTAKPAAQLLATFLADAQEPTDEDTARAL